MANRNRGGTATYPQQTGYAGGNFPQQGQQWQGGQPGWSPQAQGQYMIPQITQTNKGAIIDLALAPGVSYRQLRLHGLGPTPVTFNLSQTGMARQRGGASQGSLQQGLPIGLSTGAGQSGSYNLTPIVQSLTGVVRQLKQAASGQSFQQGRQKRNR